MRYALRITVSLLAGLVLAQAAPGAEPAEENVTAAEPAAAADPATAAAATAGTAKIGVVDLQHVYIECKYKPEYDRRVQELAKQRMDVRNELKQVLDKKVADFRLESLLLSAEAKRAKEQELLVEQQQLNEFIGQARKAVEDLQRDQLAQFQVKVTAIVEELAAEQGLDLVLSRATVLYSNEGQDHTETVLKRLNELFDKEHAEPDPGKGS